MRASAGASTNGSRSQETRAAAGVTPPRSGAATTLVDAAIDELIEAIEDSREAFREGIPVAAAMIAGCFARGGKVLVCGNGGSAADAQHFATELVGRFKAPGRRGLPVLALTADIAVLTAWANDVGYDDVFARQVEAFGRPGDVLVGISTSGRSRNVVAAFEEARARGVRTLALLGGSGGALLPLADEALVVASSDTQRIQEVQSAVIHLVCELVEEAVLESAAGDDAEADAAAPVSLQGAARTKQAGGRRG